MGTVDDVRERLPIEQIVGEVVNLKRVGASYKGLCPFHGEKTPSFYVTPNRGRYHCFGCGADGDIFTFAMATQNLDFPEALRRLAAKAGVEVEDPREGRAGNEAALRIYEMNAAAATYFQSMLAAQAGTRARAYLERRNIAAATIDRFALGFAPDSWEGLCTRLRSAGYGDEDLVASGLAIAPEGGGPLRDRFRGRLMFPIRDAKGRILGFGGRVLDDGQPKYLNSPATAVFEKSRVLYAVEHAADAIRGSHEGVVVEGYMDALRAHQEGFANVVATLGTAITEQQVRALGRLAPRLVLALDADPAGQKAAVRAGLAALGALKEPSGSSRPGHEPPQVFVATLPDGQDPDDAIAADPEVWRRAVAQAAPLMDHYFALVEASLDRSQSEWRQEAIDTLTPAIGQLGGVGLQQTYLERLASLTGVDARYLRGITPGGIPASPSRGRTRRRAGPEPAAAPARPTVDPVRLREEYLAGLLLLHRTVPPEVRAELASYGPLTAELAPLFDACKHGRDPGPLEEDLADRLVAAASARPLIAPEKLLGEVRVLLVWLNEARAKRELLQIGRTLPDVDRETARALDSHVLEALALKEQLATRFQKEQAQYRRQTATAADEGR